MLLVPSHAACKVEYSRERIEQNAIPMLFEDAPKALDRIVLAVIRRIISQLNRALALIGELNHTLHKLSASAIVLWAIILKKQECLHLRKVRTNLLPAVEQTISDEVTGDSTGCKVEIGLIVVR